MQIIRQDFSFTYDLIHCPSTGEHIFMPGWESFNFEARAFIAFWLDVEIEAFTFNNTKFQDDWETVYRQWKEDGGDKPYLYQVLEKFLAEYENPDWIVYELTTSGASCGPGSNTSYFVVKADTLVETDPDYEEADDTPENLIEVIETVSPVNCPFCDELIRSDYEDSPCYEYAGDCPHLIFEANDYGFEQMTPRFMDNMGIPHDANTSLHGYHPKEESIDEFTCKCTIPGSVKLSVYSGHGGFLGTYYGFAP